jgi:hypothetical protein
MLLRSKALALTTRVASLVSGRSSQRRHTDRVENMTLYTGRHLLGVQLRLDQINAQL